MEDFTSGFTSDLISSEFSSYFGNISDDSKIEYDEIKKHQLECSQQCKPDCYTQKHLTEIGENRKFPYIHNWIDYTTLIRIQHSSTPDVIVRHILEMTLMSFIRISVNILRQYKLYGNCSTLKPPSSKIQRVSVMQP